MEADMKNTQLIAGFFSLVLAAVLYLLGFTEFNFIIRSNQVLAYPAAFFALKRIVRPFRAVRDVFRVADY